MRNTLAEGKPAPLTLASGQQVDIPADMVSISMKEKTLTGRWALHSLTWSPPAMLPVGQYTQLLSDMTLLVGQACCLMLTEGACSV